MVKLLPFTLCASAWGYGDMVYNSVPEFEINLDNQPEVRFNGVVAHFNSTLWDFVTMLHGESPTLMVLADAVIAQRGPETAEFQAEIEGIAAATNIPAAEIGLMQLLYDLNTLMVPIVNFSNPNTTGGFTEEDMSSEMMYDELGEIPELAGFSIEALIKAARPFRFGCTGIIATSDTDGTVYHARNLDFAFADHLQRLSYTGIFTKGGVEIFRVQSIAAFPHMVTGMRKGANGYSMEINTRFPDHWDGNKEMLSNLFVEKRALSGWTKRKIFEDHDNYEDAVEALSNTPYASTEYTVISGVGKGCILARNPDGLAYEPEQLSASNKKYIIKTNFDTIWGDVREHFDPTSAAGFGRSRRKAATRHMNLAWKMTPKLLLETIQLEQVMAKDTIFQVIMNVELGTWETTAPCCIKCKCDSDLTTTPVPVIV